MVHQSSIVCLVSCPLIMCFLSYYRHLIFFAVELRFQFRRLNHPYFSISLLYRSYLASVKVHPCLCFDVSPTLSVRLIVDGMSLTILLA